ncbi:MAG: imidazolonepropionase [Chthoniobacterales bacterium]
MTLAGPARPRAGAELRELGIIQNGGMFVRDGLVDRVGSSDEIARALPRDCTVVDAEQRVVLPGFVDAHTHPVFAGNRVDEFEMRVSGASYEEIARHGGGIQSTVRKTRSASEKELFEQASRHAEWFLECGTTTAEAKSGYGLSVVDEIKILRVIHELNAASPIEFVPTFLGAHAIPPDCDDYLDVVIDEMMPRVADEHLAEYCDVFCERGYFDVDASRQVLTAAKRSGLKLRMHADQLTNSGAAKLAGELGAATADHLEQTGADGIAAMKAAGVQPVLLPASVFSLGKTRYPLAREMIDAGLAVVLATDFNPGSSPTASLQMVLSLAATQMKMSIAEGLSACTINAAYSLNRGDSVGSLESGKLANFAIFDCSDYRELGYWFGRSQTRAVFVRGEQVFGA